VEKEPANISTSVFKNRKSILKKRRCFSHEEDSPKLYSQLCCGASEKNAKQTAACTRPDNALAGTEENRLD
jgi:hypothetical protein